MTHYIFFEEISILMNLEDKNRLQFEMTPPAFLLKICNVLNVEINMLQLQSGPVILTYSYRDIVSIK